MSIILSLVSFRSTGEHGRRDWSRGVIRREETELVPFSSEISSMFWRLRNLKRVVLFPSCFKVVYLEGGFSSPSHSFGVNKELVDFKLWHPTHIITIWLFKLIDKFLAFSKRRKEKSRDQSKQTKVCIRTEYEEYKVQHKVISSLFQRYHNYIVHTSLLLTTSNSWHYSCPRSVYCLSIVFLHVE